ncbi:YfgM family protein [Endozoicomonas lisbonensis]|uniref:YfgM family protein n=1 Tax=Endozoicomonas lisbonensis TaxID=3120522 RepID=UPI0033965D87
MKPPLRLPALYQNLLETTQAGQMAEALSEEQKTTMTHVVSNLQDDYSGTRYASFATMIQAQQQVLENDLDSARASLEWVLDNKPEAEVEQVARTRLARVILGQGDENAQVALDVLAAGKADEAFTATVEGVRGDAYVALGQLDKARAAYQKALEAARDHGESLPVLQFKLDDLAANVKEG